MAVDGIYHSPMVNHQNTKNDCLVLVVVDDDDDD
jgi:hypothetical protein